GRRAVPRRAPAALRRRAEPGRAVPLAADAGDRGGEVEAALAPSLQRTADLLQLYRRGHPRRRRDAAGQDVRTGGPAATDGQWHGLIWTDTHDFHSQTQGRPSVSAAQRARPRPPRLRGRALDAVRRLRTRFHHRRDRGGVLAPGARAA